MMKYNRIIVIGDGWGTIAVLNGLQNFSLPIYVVSADNDVLRLAPNIAEENLVLYQNELLLFAGYKPFVPEDVLCKNTCINIHYSLLPAYRGLHSTVWAILNDEPYLGATIHLMNRYMDDGPILYQYKVENDYKSTSCQYMNLFNDHISSVISSILNDFINKKIMPINQDKSRASWVGRRTEKDCQMDFSQPICYQKAFFRALVSPYPLPYILHKGNKYIIRKVDYHFSDVITHIGRILNIDNEGVWVKCADGYIIIKELMDENGNQVSYNTFRIGQYFNQ